MRSFYCLIVTFIILSIGSIVFHQSEKTKKSSEMRIIYQTLDTDNDDYEGDLMDADPKDIPHAN